MPPSRAIQEFPLTFEGGLVTEVENSTLEVGQAASLVNWDPTAQGGLRTRNAWSAISTDGLVIAADGLPGNYQVRGWGTAATGSGGGFDIPAIVQEASDSGVESGFEYVAATKTVTLNGCTAGNIMIAIVTVMDSSPEPTVGGTGGFTQRATVSAGTVTRQSLYTKTTAGGTETISFTQATNVSHVHMFEVSGLATEAPTDTDFSSCVSGTPLNASCASVAGSGFALSFALSRDDIAFQDPPNLSGGTTQWSTRDDVATGRNIGVTANFSGSTVTDTIEPDTFNQSTGGLAIWDASTAASSPAEFYLFLAVATSTGYSVYRIPRNQILTGTWELVDSATCDDTSGFVSMAVGAGTLVWSASTMDVPRAVVLSTLTPSDVTDLDTLAGRAVCHHKDRMFVAGSADEPSRVYFSDIGDPDAFTTATDFLDVGGDDGEAIEDMLSVEGLLLVCKTNRIYLISGSGIESFFVNELAGGSAATGRAAVRTPYGTIVAGPADIWVVQGGGVDPMSRPLGADYSITGLVSTAYAQDSVLIADSATGRVWRANLVTGAWALEEVNDDENTVGHLFSLQGRLYYGVIDSATEVGGTRRLSSDRSYDFVGGTSFEASTGKLALLGPSVTYTPSHLYLQVRNHDATLPNALHVQVITDIGTQEQAFMVDEEVKRYRLDLGEHRNASWIQVAYSADSSAIAGALDVERSVLATYVDAIR